MSSHRSDGPLRDLQDLRFAHLPMGVYIVDMDGRLLDCNPAAREIFGLSATDAAPARVTDLHAEPAHYATLLAEAASATREGNGAKKAMLHLRVAGRDVYVEEVLRGIPSAAGDGLDGYVGCLVDITDEHAAAQQSEALKQKVEELTFDIGRILHANTSTLLMVNQTLDAAAHSLDPELTDADTAGDEPDLDARISAAAGELARALERMLEAGDETRRGAALPEESWQMLGRQVDMLLHYEQRIPIAEMRTSALRTIAAKVGSTARSLKAGKVPKEPVRDVTRGASVLERLTCWCDIRTTRQAVIQMDATLRALRDFITSEIRTYEVREHVPVSRLVQEATAQLHEFAKASHVDLVWRDRGEDLIVFGSERELVRAIANILHNAIKYSWRRQEGKEPWVSIRATASDDDVSIEIENWGVPISIEEIGQGLIFELGYRGKWSTDRGRLGTGIGLTDSKRCAESHGGALLVESRPARPTSPDPDHRDYHRQPFLTKVTLRLPLAIA